MLISEHMEPQTADKQNWHIMSKELIASYLDAEKENGASKDSLRQRKGFVNALYQWLPENKMITKPILQTWRQEMKEKGYSEDTILNYVKGINRYLNHVGREDLRFQKGKAKDLTGQQFGYLTALEPTTKRYRKDIIWRCRCKCGAEIEMTATRLLSGNTLSCGCLRKGNLQSANANQYIEGTNLRQALENKVESTKAKSGYTGVVPRDGKWRARIRYKGKNYYLGTYSKIEDAVKARARAKEWIQEDALELLEAYQELHKHDPKRPSRETVAQKVKMDAEESIVESKVHQALANKVESTRAKSGYTGVIPRDGKWRALINYQGKRYYLGSYSEIEDAVNARTRAKEWIQEDALAFMEWYQELCKNDLQRTSREAVAQREKK